MSKPNQPPGPRTVWIFCDGSTGALYERAEPETRGVRLGGEPELVRLLQQASTCAAAALARAEDGRILDWAWEALERVNNNEAEYAGLILGLRLAQRLRVQSALCVLDSAVVVGQMQGRFSVNSASLRRWHWRACAEARQVPHVRYCLVPRAWNRLADGLAGQASMPWPTLRQAVTTYDQHPEAG
jgi:ribonuclease HI